jgi:hypothetical protein
MRFLPDVYVCEGCGEESDRPLEVCEVCDSEICDDCREVCAECGLAGCKGCMMYDTYHGEYFCKDLSPEGLNISECLERYNLKNGETE